MEQKKMEDKKWEFDADKWNPEKATVKIAELRNDPAFVKIFVDTEHPEHKKALEFQTRLYQVAADHKPIRVPTDMDKILQGDGMSKEEARIWIKNLLADDKFRADYCNTARVGHQLAKEKMTALYAIAYADDEHFEDLP